jgi:hypothetical protein
MFLTFLEKAEKKMERTCRGPTAAGIVPRGYTQGFGNWIGGFGRENFFGMGRVCDGLYVGREFLNCCNFR